MVFWIFVLFCGFFIWVGGVGWGGVQMCDEWKLCATWSLLQTLACLMITRGASPSRILTNAFLGERSAVRVAYELFCCYNGVIFDALWNLYLKCVFVSMCLKQFHGVVRRLPRLLKPYASVDCHESSLYKLEKLLCEGVGQFCPN